MLGPFFIGGFFNGTWRRLVVSWGLVVFVGLLGVFTAHCPYPWRQSIDAGVFVGLAWGVAATLYYTCPAAAGRERRGKLRLAEARGYSAALRPLPRVCFGSVRLEVPGCDRQAARDRWPVRGPVEKNRESGREAFNSPIGHENHVRCNA